MSTIILVLLVLTFIIWLRKNLHRVLRPQLRKGIIGIYISVLFLMSLIFFVVQPDEITSKEKIDQPPSLFESMYEYKYMESLEEYKVESWEVPIEENTLRLQAIYEGYRLESFIPVIVTEVDREDEVAQVTYYETPSILNGYDFSDHIQLPTIEVKDSEVVARITGEPVEYEFQSIRHDAILQQFTETDEGPTFLDFSIGEIGIVIEVPKETAIIADATQFDLIRR
mgnify:FL=1